MLVKIDEETVMGNRAYAALDLRSDEIPRVGDLLSLQNKIGTKMVKTVTWCEGFSGWDHVLITVVS